MSVKGLGAAFGVGGTLALGLAVAWPTPVPSPSRLAERPSERSPTGAQQGEGGGRDGADGEAEGDLRCPAPLPAAMPGAESRALRTVRLVGDDAVAKEDDSLRRLLAREAAQRGEGSRRALADWMLGLTMPEIPVRPDERVEQYVRYFTETADGRALVTAWLKRSGQYRSAVRGILAERGLPLDLDAVAFVESGFSPYAASDQSAVGLWQLMPETARAYGLTVAEDYDERRSIRVATDAAARLLTDLFARFGSWDLALAAYNLGYGRLVSRMRDVTTYDFWVLARNGVLPQETAVYVPKVLAMAVVLRNLARYDFDDTLPLPPLQVSDLPVPAKTPLYMVARAAGTTLQKIRELNPEVLMDRAPEGKGDVAVHVPSEGLTRARVVLPRLLSDQRVARERDAERRRNERRAAKALARMAGKAPAVLSSPYRTSRPGR